MLAVKQDKAAGLLCWILASGAALCAASVHSLTPTENEPTVKDSCCYPYAWRSFPARSAGVCWKQGKADKRHLCLAFPVVSITGRAFRVACLHEGWCNHTQFSASAHRCSVARMHEPPHVSTASWTPIDCLDEWMDATTAPWPLRLSWLFTNTRAVSQGISLQHSPLDLISI